MFLYCVSFLLGFIIYEVSSHYCRKKNVHNTNIDNYIVANDYDTIDYSAITTLQDKIIFHKYAAEYYQKTYNSTSKKKE